MTPDDSKQRIAGYCRISVDTEQDSDNTSIENQKTIIGAYVKNYFPNATLDFYEDRDRSGYTFEQREGYQELRKKMLCGEYDILIVKDFSRFSRRNSRGLVELEDLRDAGMRIISINDGIDFPKNDEWVHIQFRFLLNEMPVTDTSKKIRSVITSRQREGRWICSVPYGYVMTNYKKMTFEVEPSEAEVIRMIYSLYNQGWGYWKIADYLTDKGIPTPRAKQKQRKEERDGESRLKASTVWNLTSIQEILHNDFYIGTLRQGKYTRAKINGDDVRRDKSEHIVFENHHEAIIDYKTFVLAQEETKARGCVYYRGQKKYDTSYSGFLVCGDCGSPMYSRSRPDMAPSYVCGAYFKRGLKACTSHHIKVESLDDILKSYLRQVRDNSSDMIERLEASIKAEMKKLPQEEGTIARLQASLEKAKSELATLFSQKTKEIIKRPEAEDIISETFDELISECEAKIRGIESEIELGLNRRNTIIQACRLADTAISVFDEILKKDKLDKADLRLLVDKIIVYEDHIHIKLKSDIEKLLMLDETGKNEGEIANFQHDSKGISYSQQSANTADKVFTVNVVYDGSPSLTTLTVENMFYMAILSISNRCNWV